MREVLARIEIEVGYCSAEFTKAKPSVFFW